MSESSSKRRKTSPTTSVPTGTPSLQPQNAPEPTFASPTRASTARSDAQLSSRGRRPGRSLNAPVSRGANLDDLFSKALGDATPSKESGKAEGSKVSRTLGGNFSTKPKRISKSPVKSSKKAQKAIEPPINLEGVENPFARRGLRRSPISGQAGRVAQESPAVDEQVNPFQRRGLRRSPVASQPPQVPEATEGESQAVERFTTTPPGPPPGSAIYPTERSTEQGNLAVESETRPNVESREDNNAEKLAAPINIPISQTLPETAFQEVQTTMDVATIAARALEEEERMNPSGSVEQPVTISKPKVVPSPSKTSAPIVAAPSSKKTSHAVDSTEPELPPTPTQRGLADPVVTTPPKGIHNTPSKRGRPRRGKIMKSSPLKPRDERPEEASIPEPLPMKISKDVPEIIEKPSSEPKKLPKRRKSARFLVPEDPYAEKKRERDLLLKQLQQLQADVKLANQEAERQRQQAEATSKNEHQPSKSTKESEALVKMLLRATTPLLQKPSPPPTQKTLFSSIDSFLPFRSRRKQNQLSVATLKSLEKPLPSLLPLAQSNPFPFLQAFSPLHYTSTISILPPTPTSSPSPDSISEGSQHPQLQEHTISASHPSSLFHARLSLVVDTSNHSIHSLTIPALDPAAEHELGPFIRSKAKTKEISAIGWAMGRWTEVAITRARFWCAVEEGLVYNEARKRTIEEVVREKSRKRKRAGTADVEGEQDEDLDANTALKPTTAKEKKWTRRELLPHLGRTTLEISSSSPSTGDTGSKGDDLILRIAWEMEFDWTGEVESHITAAVKLPDAWRATDDRNSLAEIPTTFQRLVKREGPLGAVKSLVVLLFGES